MTTEDRFITKQQCLANNPWYLVQVITWMCYFSLVNSYYGRQFSGISAGFFLCAPLEGVWERLWNAFGIGLCWYCPALHLHLAEPLEKVSAEVYRAYQWETRAVSYQYQLFLPVGFLSPCRAHKPRASSAPRPHCIAHTGGSLVEMHGMKEKALNNQRPGVDQGHDLWCRTSLSSRMRRKIYHVATILTAHQRWREGSPSNRAKVVAPPQPSISRSLRNLGHLFQVPHSSTTDSAQRQIHFVCEIKNYKPPPSSLWCHKCHFGLLTNCFKPLPISLTFCFFSFTTFIFAWWDFGPD